eukprot:TRINITY_DN6930_c0_g3_i1.p1 TRINITY_DN6930_c0_g3~~TRINITY_DN6930_c0_g3_i1.p1  ORF type:complete len:626 (+),score=131.73 TRINITY_DN6930_c0_g3_i1:165-2042(+)
MDDRGIPVGREEFFKPAEVVPGNSRVSGLSKPRTGKRTHQSTFSRMSQEIMEEIAATKKEREKDNHCDREEGADEELTKETGPVDDVPAPRAESTVLDAAAMKEKVRLKLNKPKYDVSFFYKTQGMWQAIARNAAFEKVTLGVILLNACWIAVDTDLNQTELLTEAHPVFQVAENFFCAFFSTEWLIRYMSFRRKIDGLRDSWFVFDMLMCIMMVVETWVLTCFIIMSGGGAPGMAGGAIVKSARLMRLSRMFRMAKILRAMPELFVMLKGLRAAARSVFFTLLLLGVIVFIFGIAFTQLAKSTKLAETEFLTVLDTMHFLLVHGTLLLSTDAKAKEIGETGGPSGPLLEALFFMFILLAAVLLMNMLIGVLCEVVSAVSEIESEEILVSYVESKLTKVMALIDEDGGGTISRDEFNQILDNAEAIDALQDVGVDVIGLVDFSDFIFGDEGEKEEDEEVELTMPEFMEVVLSLRGSNSATVKDVVDLRKFIGTTLQQTTHRLDEMDVAVDAIFGMIQDMNSLLREVLGQVTNRSLEMKKLIGARAPFCADVAVGLHADSIVKHNDAVVVATLPVADKPSSFVPGVPNTPPPAFKEAPQLALTNGISTTNEKVGLISAATTGGGTW